MKKRAEGTRFTRTWVQDEEIFDIVFRFPTLHAYGVGFKAFESLPEDRRLAAIEYSKYLLAYCLDEEIDSAMIFLRALNCHEHRPKVSWYVKLSYLMGLYRSWRKMTGRCHEYVPPGCFIFAALFYGQGVHVRPELRPDCLITIPKMRREYLENYLAKEYGYVRPPDSEVYYDFYAVNDDRADEVGNEPQRVDAIYNVNGEENGNSIWRQINYPDGEDFVPVSIREGEESGPGEGGEVRGDAFDSEDGGYYDSEDGAGEGSEASVRDKVRKPRKTKASTN